MRTDPILPRVAAAFLLVAGVAGFLGYLQFHRIEVAGGVRASEEMRGLADLKAAQLALWLKERRSDADAAASNPFVLPAVDDLAANRATAAVRGDLSGWLAGFARAYGYCCVGLHDREGRLRIGYSKDQAPVSEADARSLREAIAAGRDFFTTRHREAGEDVLHLGVVRPMGGGAAPATVLLLQSPMKAFVEPLLRRWPNPLLTGETLLLQPADGRMRLLGGSRTGPNGVLTDLTWTRLGTNALVDLAASGKTELIRGPDHRGVEFLGALRRIEGTDWLLITKVDHAEVDAQVVAAALRVGVLALLVLLTLLALAAWWWRQQQVRSLSEELRAQEELRARDARFRAYLEHASEKIFILDREGRIKQANRLACQSLGYPPEELAERRLDAVEAGLDLARFRRVLDSLSPGQTLASETVYRRKDGSTFPVEVRIGRFEGDDETVYLLFARDISERKQREEQLRLKSARFAALFASAPVALVILDEAETITACNGRHGELTGLGQGEVETWADWWLRLFPEQSDRDARYREWQSIREDLQTGQVSRNPLEWRIQCPGGGSRVVEVLASRLGGDTLVSLVDVTERKRSEDALRASEVRFRAIIETSPVPFALVNAAGRITYFNPAFTRSYGYEVQDVPDLDAWWSQAYPEPAYRAEIRARWTNAVAESQAPANAAPPVEAVIRCKHGEFRTVSAFAVRLGEPAEGITLVVMHDITMVRRREADLAYQAALSQLLLDIPAEAERVGEIGLMQTALRRLEDLTGSGFGALRLVSAEGSPAAWTIESGRLLVQRSELPAGAADPTVDWVAGLAQAEAGPVVVHNDWAGRGPGEEPGPAVPGLRRWVRLTVQEAGRVVMVVALANKAAEYSARDGEALRLAAESLWQVTQRRRLQSRLQMFSLAIEQGPSSVVITDLTGVIEYVNPRLTEVTGYQLADLRGKTPRVFRSGRTPQARYEELWRTITSGGTWRGELVNRKKNGEEHTELVVISPVHDATGKPTHYLAIKEDITGIRGIEARLTASEVRHAQVLSSAMDGFWLLDREGRILEVNEAYCRLSGYSEAELLRMSVRDLLPAEDLEAAGRHMQGIINCGSDRCNCRHRRKDGSLVQVEVSVTYLRAGGGQFACFIRDITGQLAAASRLELQSVALESAANAILITRPDGEIEWVNEAFVQSSGYTREEVLGRNPRLLKSGEHDPGYYAGLWRTISAGSVWRGEMINRRKDGRLIVEDVTVTPVLDAGRQIRHFVAIKQDITERRTLEKQFLRSQRMEGVGLLAAGIAHDLNNVLAPILMSVELLREEALPATASPILQGIEASARRGADVVRQVLTFARGGEANKGPLQLRHLVKDFVRMISETFPRNLRINTLFTQEPRPINGDATQLDQVLLNLAVNARDAMPAGGELTFKVFNTTLTAPRPTLLGDLAPGNYVVLEVADTGAGMSAEVREKIFQPFFTTKEQGKGTGLGLATVLGIVKGHQGAIEVRSAPGEGTVFTLYFPPIVAESPDAAAAVTAAPQRLPRGLGELILVVDDEEPVARVTEAILKRYGYRTLSARDGVEGLAVFTRHQAEIALVLTDAMMPLMDGPTLIGEVLRVKPTIPCLLASGLLGDSNSERIAELKAQGKCRLLQKPYTLEALLECVDEQLH